MTKKSSFGMRVVLYLGGELVYGIFVMGSVHILEGCSEDFMYFSFLISYIILLYKGLVAIYLLTYIVFIFLYI